MLVSQRIEEDLFFLFFKQLRLFIEGIVHEVGGLGVAERLGSGVFEYFLELDSLLINLPLPYY